MVFLFLFFSFSISIGNIFFFPHYFGPLLSIILETRIQEIVETYVPKWTLYYYYYYYYYYYCYYYYFGVLFQKRNTCLYLPLVDVTRTMWLKLRYGWTYLWKSAMVACPIPPYLLSLSSSSIGFKNIKIRSFANLLVKSYLIKN